MLPPKDTASENVTKSPLAASFDASVTVIVDDPSVAAKVTELVDVLL